MTRREFTKSLVLVSFAAFGGTGALAVASALRGRPTSYPAVKVADVDEIAPGSSKVFSYPAPGETCLLIRIDRDRFAAFGQKCTHLG